MYIYNREGEREVAIYKVRFTPIFKSFKVHQSSSIHLISYTSIYTSFSSIRSATMNFQGVLLVVAMAGLQLTQAQNVTDCTSISFGLGTATVDPVTGDKTVREREIETS